MRRKTVRNIGFFALILMLLFSFAACGGGDEADGNQDGPGVVGSAIFDTYVYLPAFSPLAHVAERIQAALVHEERIYFCYVTESAIVIESILPDGSSVARTEIPHAGTFVDIAGLRITEEGNFSLVFADTEWAEAGGGEAAVYYAQYTPEGAEILRREIPWRAHPAAIQSHFTQALFAADGSLILVVETWSGDDFFRTVHLFDAELSPRAQLDANFPVRPIPMAETRDGRVLIADMEPCQWAYFRPALREIDLARGVWGETFLIPAGLHAVNIHSLLPAREDSFFDLYIVDARNLLGFDLETGQKTIVIDWMESQLLTAGLELHLGFLDTGQISLLICTRRGEEWETERALLTRTARADLPEREVITLGGLGISHEGMIDSFQAQIMEFNRRSQTHRIEIVDYLRGIDIGDSAAGWAARDRLLMDMMTGQGPDILFGGAGEFAALRDAAVFLDLYPFIDADPELSRSDFLPNILALAELEDGSLPILPFAFALQTLAGMEDIVGDIDPWTFIEMRALIEEAIDAGVPHILRNMHGGESCAVNFLWRALNNCELGFLNWTDNTADLDNEAFIHFLELAVRLPRDTTFLIEPIQTKAAWMHSGETLLQELYLSDINRYQAYRMMFGEEMVFLGWPSREGGGHVVDFVELAILASSDHPEAAWEFVRLFVMPDVELRNQWRLSLRIDALDAMIADAMTPRFETDRDGNEVEVPRYSIWAGGDFMLELYAITQEQAEEFRSIVKSASTHGHSLFAIWDIIAEELLPLLAGDRSAADTARIMQNRVQTFLWERG